MSTQASNIHALSSVDGHTHNKTPIPAIHHDKLEHSQLDKLGGAGTPYVEDVYDTVLPWWRATIRAKILSSVKRESQILARMQARIVHQFNISMYIMTFCRNAYDTRGWTCIFSIVQLLAPIRSS
jgi:hypothetical protein